MGDKLRMIAERVMGWNVCTQDGHEHDECKCIQSYTGVLDVLDESGCESSIWNPLASDSDAAELRRRLWEIGYEYIVSACDMACVSLIGKDGHSHCGESITNSDPIAAERRALVDAAADVAGKMEAGWHCRDRGVERTVCEGEQESEAEMKAKIKPCPFCGGTKTAMLKLPSDDMPNYMRACRSGNCGGSTAWHYTEHYADRAWNRRTKRKAKAKR